MRLDIGILVLAVTASIGGAIYGWGIGWFYPCGPLDRVLRLSACHIVADIGGGPIEAVMPLSDDRLLAVLRDDGTEPQHPQRLAEVSLMGGQVSGEIPLSDLPKDAAWMSAALSPDGKLIAASLLNQRVGLIDRESGKLLRWIEPWYNVAMVDFLDDERVMIDRGNVSSERPPARLAQVFSVADGTQLADVSGETTFPLYRKGLAMALSPDGAWLAQHVETRGDSGVVGVRLADANFIDWSGQLLVGPLGSWGLADQSWPDLWFSPDSKFVAAQFDGAAVWGKDTSALLIWEVETRKLVQRIPTYHAMWENLVWRPDERQVVATRFNIDSRRNDVAIIDY